MRRETRQRKILRQVLREAERPLSPQEILDAAQDRLPGLGLATVISIMDSHDGRIECISAKGAGATFNLYIPAHGGDLT